MPNRKSLLLLLLSLLVLLLLLLVYEVLTLELLRDLDDVAREVRRPAPTPSARCLHDCSDGGDVSRLCGRVGRGSGGRLRGRVGRGSSGGVY